jgi:hypothetical protein
MTTLASALRLGRALPIAGLAAALTTACSDTDPVAPGSRAAAAAAPIAAKAPSASLVTPAPGMAIGDIWTLTADGKSTVIGATVRVTTDKGFVDVTDQGAGDLLLGGGGRMFVSLPGNSTSYKAEVIAVPVGYHLPSGGAVYGTLGTDAQVDGPAVNFPSFMLSAKKQLRIAFRDRQRKLISGATVVITAPGLDVMYTLTDGGAGDLTPLGEQAPADGIVTFYVPGDYMSQIKVCEQSAPAGYALANPSCQTVTNWTYLNALSATFTHEVGIVAPPAEM